VRLGYKTRSESTKLFLHLLNVQDAILTHVAGPRQGETGQLTDKREFPQCCVYRKADYMSQGEGSGELFSPIETGEYEAMGGSTILEMKQALS
jgi:hypothetical protein